MLTVQGTSRIQLLPEELGHPQNSPIRRFMSIRESFFSCLRVIAWLGYEPEGT